MVYNIEWVNENSNRKFPFIAESTLRDRFNSFFLPTDFIVDATLMLSLDFQFNFFLSNMTYSPEVLSLTFSMATGAPALTGTIQNPNSLEKNQTLYVQGQERYIGSFGTIIIGSLENIPEGEYDFFFSATQVEPCRIVKLNRGIASLNGITSGNVILEEGTNTLISVEGKRVTIDTSDGVCQCNNSGCIETINGIPSVDGNFDIRGIGCVSVNPLQSNGIQVSNTCEDACCGCEPVNDFIDELRELTGRVATLENELPPP